MMTERDMESRRSRSAASSRPATQWSYRPRIDLYDTEDAIIGLVDLPGAKEDAIDIHFTDGVLRIHARVETRQPRNINYDIHEFGVGDFDREIDVGNAIDPDNVQADLKHGVLRLHMPKASWAKPRRIDIQSK